MGISWRFLGIYAGLMGISWDIYTFRKNFHGVAAHLHDLFVDHTNDKFSDKL